MANLTKAQLTELASVNIIGVKTVEEACAKMRAVLESQEIAGLETEPFENLIIYCQAFVDDEPVSAADESSALAREVENEDNIAAARKMVEEDDDEEPLPLSKKQATAPTKPAPAAPVKKQATVAPTKPAPAAKKAPTPPAQTANGTKFDGANYPEHMELLVFLHQFFNTEETQYHPLKQGVTLRALLANTRPTVMNFDEVRITQDGLVGNLYLNKFKSVEDLEALLPDGFTDKYRVGMFRGETHPCIRSISQDAIVELLTTTGIVSETLRRVGKLDDKMGANRDKMVETLKSGAQKSAAAKAAPTSKKK